MLRLCILIATVHPHFAFRDTRSYFKKRFRNQTTALCQLLREGGGECVGISFIRMLFCIIL